jgi:hypothetical protein
MPEISGCNLITYLCFCKYIFAGSDCPLKTSAISRQPRAAAHYHGAWQAPFLVQHTKMWQGENAHQMK